MSSVVIRGGDGNRYPARVTSDGKLQVDTEITLSGVSIDNVTVADSSSGTAARLYTTAYGGKNVLATAIYDANGNLVDPHYQDPIQISGVTVTAGGRIPVDTEVYVSLDGEIGIESQPPVIVSGIVDALPTGANTIGAVNLQDGSGNDINSLDGSLKVDLLGISGNINTVAGNIGTIDSAFSGGVSVNGGKAESTVPTEVADADAVATWMDTFGRQILYGSNLGQSSLDVSEVAPPATQSGYYTIHSAVRIDNSPTEATSAATFVGDKNKLTIMNSITVTDVGGGPSLDYSIQVSPDASTWIEFHDIGISGTSVSGITYGGTYTDTFTVPIDYAVQYIRTKLSGRDTDATNYVDVTSYLNYKQG
jgi:hypothetical protein